MRFKLKITDGEATWWEEHDRADVSSQRDAFTFGKVLVEFWNGDLRPGEFPRKVLNAAIIGRGKAKTSVGFFPTRFSSPEVQ